jgi:hypothetical protein
MLLHYTQFSTRLVTRRKFDSMKWLSIFLLRQQTLVTREASFPHGRDSLLTTPVVNHAYHDLRQVHVIQDYLDQMYRPRVLQVRVIQNRFRFSTILDPVVRLFCVRMSIQREKMRVVMRRNVVVCCSSTSTRSIRLQPHM